MFCGTFWTWNSNVIVILSFKLILLKKQNTRSFIVIFYTYHLGVMEKVCQGKKALRQWRLKK